MSVDVYAVLESELETCFRHRRLEGEDVAPA